MTTLEAFFATSYRLLGFELVALALLVAGLGLLAGLWGRRLVRPSRAVETTSVVLSALDLLLAEAERSVPPAVGRLVELATNTGRPLPLPRPAGQAEPGGTRPPLLLVVRHAKRRAFEALRAHVEKPGLVHVVWDRRAYQERRLEDRPVATDRRREPRRRPPAPHSWDALGFILVREADGGPPRVSSCSRPATPRSVPRLAGPPRPGL